MKSNLNEQNLLARMVAKNDLAEERAALLKRLAEIDKLLPSKEENNPKRKPKR